MRDDAWGQPFEVNQATAQQYRFSQKELDPDFIAFNSNNRRYHFPRRTYIAFRGSFLQIDPVQFVAMRAIAQRSLYVYVSANPTGLVDPAGLQPKENKYKCCGQPGFPDWRKVVVDFYTLFGSVPNINRDLERAKKLWEQCCIMVFQRGGIADWNKAETERRVGGELAVHIPRVNFDEMKELKLTPTAEMLKLTADQNKWADFIYAYYAKEMEEELDLGRVKKMVPSLNSGFSFASLLFESPPYPGLVIGTDLAQSNTLAHEIGHMLGLGHELDRDNLMFGGTREEKSKLTDDQCDIARKSGLVKRFLGPAPR